MIQITDKDFNLIKNKAFNYPFINKTQLEELPWTDEDLKNYMIEPSLEEYYRYFPLKVVNANSISISDNGTVEIPYPDENTYGVADCRFTNEMDSNLYTDSLGVNTGNPIVTFRTISKSGYRLGSRYDYGFDTIRKSTQAGQDSLLNANKVFRYYSDEINRKVDAYSSMQGYVAITWAKISENFSDIPFVRKREVIDLCIAEIKMWWGKLLAMQDSEFPVEMDGQTMYDDGEEIKEKIITLWREAPKVVVYRN